MAHDLAKYLAEAKASYEFQTDVGIGWADDKKLAADLGGTCWGVYSQAKHCIVIAKSLKRAPRFVIRYLVKHELLHHIVGREGCNWHPRRFRVAEQSMSEYLPACRWLHKFALRQNEKTRKIAQNSYYWRRVVGPIYDFNYQEYLIARAEARRA